MTYLDYIKVRYSEDQLVGRCDEISSCGSGNLSIRLENILVNLAKYLNCKKILQITKYIVTYSKRTLSNKYKLIVVLVDMLSVRWNRLLWSRQPFAPRHPGRDHPPRFPPVPLRRRSPQLSRKPRHYYQLPKPCSAGLHNAETNYPAIFPPGEDDVGSAVNTMAVSAVASPHIRSGCLTTYKIRLPHHI